jgi:thiamine-phosphate pyrophosphorylase
MKRLDQCRFYTFIDTAYLGGRPVEWLAEQLCRGGADLIQLRAKGAAADQVLSMAGRIAPVLRAHGVGLVINDFPGVALASGAACAHLGQEDFFDAGHTRKADLIPPSSSCLLGLSTHAPAQAERAVAAGADYVAIGPVYPTGTKPGAVPVTLDYVRWAAGHLSLPWFAIGGIHAGNLEQVLAAGARRICVVSAILQAPDPAEACQKLKERLLSVPL